MSDGSHIEWTDATWSPITGCTIVSPGCARCYAMKLAGGRLRNHPSRKGLTKPSKAGPVWTGEVRLNEDWLTQPLQWKAPRMIFVCAHGDLFHEDVPDEWIDRVFAVMALAPQHTFQVLTKRAKRMRHYMGSCKTDGICLRIHEMLGRPDNGPAETATWSEYKERIRVGLRNVWLGVSAERQQEADERIPDLLATTAAVRFVSAEPMLGPINFGHVPHAHGWGSALEPGQVHGGTGQCVALTPALDWVIVGGESGHGARPMHPDWARSIRNQCQAAGAAFFFKQWGAWQPFQPPMVYDEDWQRSGNSVVAIDGTLSTGDELSGGRRIDHPLWCRIRNVGKKAAGRLLDGRTWDEMPADGNQALALEPTE